jgi:hypothetical protein
MLLIPYLVIHLALKRLYAIVWKVILVLVCIAKLIKRNYTSTKQLNDKLKEALEIQYSTCPMLSKMVCPVPIYTSRYRTPEEPGPEGELVSTKKYGTW